MSGFILPTNFASQSECAPMIAEQIAQERGFVCLVEASRYPAAGCVRISGLRPLRHYRLRGAADGFCCTDSQGFATVVVSVVRSSLLILEAVIA